MHPQPISGTCSPPVCIKFSLLAWFSLEPITNWLKKPEKEDFSCLSCTKIGESEVWICFDPWIIFLSCKISICLEPGTAPKLGKVYFSQTSEIVFVEYRDLGSSSLMDGNCNFLAVQDSSITDIVCLSVCLSLGLSQLTIRAYWTSKSDPKH